MNENEKEKRIKEAKSLFKAMNYEIAGEIGAIDPEDMNNNRKLDSNTKDNKK